MDLYSASAEDRETEACFFDFQDIGEPPRLIKNPLMDLRELGKDPQSASQKASNLNEGSADRNNPWLGFERRYRNTLNASAK